MGMRHCASIPYLKLLHKSSGVALSGALTLLELLLGNTEFAGECISACLEVEYLFLETLLLLGDGLVRELVLEVLEL